MEHTASRRRAFEELQEVSKNTVVSQDIQAALMLRSSGLSHPQQAAVLGRHWATSTSSTASRTLFRIQYPNIRLQAPRQDRRHSAYAGEDYEDEEGAKNQDEEYDEEHDE